ncbi:dual specificity protein phosphatase family protein [Sulfitobacter sp. SK011]|uniref:protein-tyrosine phosphatase family protein n=1 Tax=Sulfitobacter sp. SK011 TaxID=1389004 RepID=UPI000E0A8AC7|nr:dual specificity protein phosphatase family protein [Sulfitobacter sp. SK011]AXI44044.1 tyrosine protein phosphatase [Sulfitobacter sp. SK011]
MTPEIYLVAADLPGSLFIMPCPNGDDLHSDIKAYRAQGVDTVVSMLALKEAEMLGLAAERVACEGAGLAFISSPIKDFGLPEILVFDPLVRRIADMLLDGKFVAVHCRAGIGRSGMVTAATLVALGSDSGLAIKQIARARGALIPDTMEQGRFIAEYEQRIRP